VEGETAVFVLFQAEFGVGAEEVLEDLGLGGAGCGVEGVWVAVGGAVHGGRGGVAEIDQIACAV